MANTVTHASAGILTGVFTNLYTVPANRKFVIKAFTVTNNTVGALTLDVRVTFTSGGVARTMVPGRSVSDGATDLVPEVINHVIDAGGIIEGQGGGLEFAISGVLVNG